MDRTQRADEPVLSPKDWPALQLRPHEFLSLNGHRAGIGFGKLSGGYGASLPLKRQSLTKDAGIRVRCLGTLPSPSGDQNETQAPYWELQRLEMRS